MSNTLPAVVFTVAIVFGPLSLIAINNAQTEADATVVAAAVSSERIAAAVTRSSSEV